MEQQDALLEERTGDVVRLTLNRPARRNALTRDLVARLADRLTALGAEGPRAVILAGGPPVFCAGGDLVDLGGIADTGAIAVTDTVYGQFHRLVRALSEAPFPVVAAIDGAALGAGLDLALACDLRVATTRSTFASSWIGVGLVPGMGGAYLLTQAVGSARAHEMVLLGAPVSATTALSWGLISRLVEEEELDGAVAALTERLAGLPAAALARSKASLRRAAESGLAAELATMGAVQGALLTGHEFAARTEAFRARSR
ncbi:MAG TPA: enoyl-CoA hydratase/isomerase family protein [Trebonia sp.]|jgi:2-(1,2-epoxy-1,2-dihydrophenyl)acetyl-CoA isomerase|nr:enoyl-CoA hydratase/isomerase family protein [Trebonia sp.]